MTSKANAYFALATRLRKAGLPFSSALPDSDLEDCDLVLTTAGEAGGFGGRGMSLESLDADPGVFKGQVLSRLKEEREVVLVGVDPGERIGLAAFYGQTELAFDTLGSRAAVCSRVKAFAKGIPRSRLLVRVGDGDRRLAGKLVEELVGEVPEATVELVDESGTSAGGSKTRGMQRDEIAAARIAFRKGEVVSPGTRNRG
ncbi:MAG: hypothetical protein JRN21_08805 [Nitrososphaerota archaeon]|nr:hypothetical protein [Nitrososphaerota archaeon]